METCKDRFVLTFVSQRSLYFSLEWCKVRARWKNLRVLVRAFFFGDCAACLTSFARTWLLMSLWAQRGTLCPGTPKIYGYRMPGI